MEDCIRTFVASLAEQPHTETTYNPYRNAAARDNLAQYLRAVCAQSGRRILMVGEALGYRGGRLTGIPFSSERLLRQAPHPFLRALHDRVAISGNTSEATATLVWAALARRRRIPLFWNAFPFHPHRRGEPASNRAPTADEIAGGQAYLQRLAALYRPQLIAGLGNKGCLAVHRALPDERIAALRHPSYGGKADFERGLSRLLQA
jgi:uracil-DNA glycosylase